MKAPKLKSFTVQGFRAYGAEQTLNLSADIVAVWGPNSKGKTSLAEAFEFLFTGSISRRELMASSQDEFADSLRHVHLAATTPTFVAATIADENGNERALKRVLEADYAKKQPCRSRLELDGRTVDETALADLVIVLSLPPLAAPILAQHTLSYIFSVGPQNRSTYFKALLEVTDLDTLRNEIASTSNVLSAPASSLLASFDRAAVIAALWASIGKLKAGVPGLPATVLLLDTAAESLLKAAKGVVPSTLEERLTAIEAVLAERRAKTFPVEEFKAEAIKGWTPPTDDTWDRLTTYTEERAKIDVETRRLVALFTETLKLPACEHLPADCPVCGTPAALDEARIAALRLSVANSEAFTSAEAAARSALAGIGAAAGAILPSTGSILPAVLTKTKRERTAKGFTLEKLRTLLGTRAAELVSPWLNQVRPLRRAARRLESAVSALQALAESQAADMEGALDVAGLRSASDALERSVLAFAAASAAYRTPEAAVRSALNQVIDTKADASGWQEFVDVARQPAALRTALIERKARATVSQELETALRNIDEAKETVLDEKFAEYSDSILTWWERLRPEETTFFAEVKPRKGARRTIDFKAGLSANHDRSAPKMRDVIAVFSQSQLHCLGLALFLARAQSEGVGFIILDDPVLSSDEDYRVHFNSTVVEALLELPIQVIVLTQDNRNWRELEIRYRYKGIATAQLYIEAPGHGTTIENTSDELLAKINRATALARGGHPDSRKECGVQLRDAGERFCKEMLIVDQRAKGNKSAQLSDYDGKTLEWLAPRVEPLLAKDGSHAGKFEVFRNTVNDACHDNAPPGTAVMVQACGEIRYLMKEYFGRA